MWYLRSTFAVTLLSRDGNEAVPYKRYGSPYFYAKRNDTLAPSGHNAAASR